MTPTQIELHNAHKARLQRIAAAAARLNPKTDREYSVALKAVEEPTEAKVEKPNDEWIESQIRKHKPLWFSIVRSVKVNRLGGPPIAAIQREVCKVFDVTLKDLLSERRTWDIMTPRMVSVYLAKELTQLSWIRIGRATGGRDHSTVMHSHRKISSLLKSNEKLAAKVAKVRERFDETANRRHHAEDTPLVAQEAARPPFDADSAGKAAICSAR